MSDTATPAVTLEPTQISKDPAFQEIDDQATSQQKEMSIMSRGGPSQKINQQTKENNNNGDPSIQDISSHISIGGDNSKEMSKGVEMSSTLEEKRAKDQGKSLANQSRAMAGTYEKTSFQQILTQYNSKQELQPAIEMTQTLLMNENQREAAARVNSLTGLGGNALYLRNEIVGDSLRNLMPMSTIGNLLGNLGQADLASNFLIEQKNLARVLACENRSIRDILDQKMVDSIEYLRMKEQLAETKARMKDILEEQFTSDEELEKKGFKLDKKLKAGEKNLKKKSFGKDINGKSIDGRISSSSDDKMTQDDSFLAAEKNRQINDQRVGSIINIIREESKQFLAPDADFKNSGNEIDIYNEKMPLSKIWRKLSNNTSYRKKRDLKALLKQQKLNETDSSPSKIQSASILEILKLEAQKLDAELSKTNVLLSKTELEASVALYEQIYGMEKRICTENSVNCSIAEIDSEQINSRSSKIQSILYSRFGLDIKEEPYLRNYRGDNKGIFQNIRRIPAKSSLLSSFLDHGESKNQQSQKKAHEYVKVIGLDTDQLFSQVSKYKVNLQKMPKFSNIFERAESLMQNVSMTVPGQVICQSSEGGQMTFARIDGRNVISLQFNPYHDVVDDPTKQKELDQALKEIQDTREKQKLMASVASQNKVAANKEKIEQANIKKAWLNIVKRDIPKAYRQYQKFKTDQENNNKKQSQNCLKEVRKKAIKTQRLQKESQIRAKKLTKDMMTFWKKRDKEITDLKRKREKYEKELRKRQEEEREAVLQKKRLEFIMQQSEIYAHFMSKKLGLSEEQQKQKQIDAEEESRDQFKRYDIDEKEARNNIASMINENRSRVNDFDTETKQRRNHNVQLSKIQEDELEIDRFDNPDESSLSNVVNPPKCFLGHLKHYQLKGLRWLDNLYEQGINGILADEMGLGKTIQAISLLAHLYENKGVWGPFLIIVPCTVLSNWQNELNKFCPSLKVLPFFGNPEERKKLGKFLDPKNLYNPNMRINVLLTSYNLIANTSKDQQKLLRVKWHYMILDEAQAIKNNLSRRWRVLLQFNTRNRLLLTGTPIQNSMAELWALLHFIMPKLFDSHEQFQEWFSKDIEANSLTDQGEINKHQLRRLHLVLKPFMLRRLKDDIELEIGPKTEYTESCQMTHRQRVLYQRIKNKISIKDLFTLAENKSKMENLMNLVMQFRKVCNHPELFERRVGRMSLTFKELQVGMQPNPLLQAIPDLRTQMKNPISFEIPKLIYDECFLLSDNNTRLFKKLGRFDNCFSELSLENHMRFFNIFNTLNLYQGAFENSRSGSIYSTLRLLSKSNKWSYREISWMHVADPIIKQIALMHYHFEKFHRKYYLNILVNEDLEGENIEIKSLRLPSQKKTKKDRNGFVDLTIVDFANHDPSVSILFRSTKVYDPKGKAVFLPPLITDDYNVYTNFSKGLKNDLDLYVAASITEPIQIDCRNSTFRRLYTSLTNSSMHKKALIGSIFKPRSEIHQLGRVGRDQTSFLELDSSKSAKYGPPTGYQLIENGILADVIQEKGGCILELPNYSRLVTDCAKMRFLDKLLHKLSVGNHRVLIFCQMTKMLDILEDYLCWRKYTYYRMDGSTNLQDRRFMVEDFQKNPNVFAFLLSTRAGGLGVNLTGADTVIFYDNDWNPTIDAQAQDRAHRIGQTKPVSVFRLITQSTVEEKIVKRAKQKQNVQSTVYGGNALKADVFRAKDVVDMLLDDDEEEDLKANQSKFLKTGRGRRPKAKPATDDANMMIDTSSKKKTSPVKPTGTTTQTIRSSDIASKSKKPASDKLFQTLKQGVQNIFTTSKQQRDCDQYMAASNSGDEEEEYEEDDDPLETEDLKAKRRLLELLNRGDDDGVAIEYNSGGEEGADKKAGGANAAAASAKKGGDEDMEDEDDIMGDEY